MTDPSPDYAEEHEEVDAAVPSRGYQLTPLVGLGGSAGSIGALRSFFRSVPPDCGLAFVVILHLSPDHESTLADLLRRGTKMRVLQVTEALKVEPNTVYVIPPGKSLRAADGQLRLGELQPDHGRHVAVDLFFRTLADAHGPHSTAIVLSGADGDGAIGIKRIKERGGLTIAQDPAEAEQPAMPLSAIATGMVDWVLPVAEMIPRVLDYYKREGEIRLPPEEIPPPPEGAKNAAGADEAALRDILTFLRARTGRDFSCYKRATILRRIGRRMQVNGIDDLQGYLSCLRTRPGESAALLQDLLISVTNFFRDAECFSAMEAHIPALFTGKRPGDTVRVWVAACASGEEAYSFAMLLSEHSRTVERPPPIQIFATDLDEEAVQTARDGIYPSTIEADVSEERLRRFFVKEHRGYRVRRELREMVLFAQHDLLKDSPFSRLDLVTCRNLLIYLNRDAQSRVFETFHFALLPGGRLFLGSSESVEDGSQLFSVLDKKHRIYSQKATPRVGLPVPTGPGTLALALEAQQAARDGPVIAGPAFGPAPAGPTRTPRPVEGRHGSWGELHFRLLEHLAPPSILVDSEHDIVHLSASAGGFLQFGGGEPSRNLLRAVHPGLRIELRAALYQAAQGGEAVEVADIPLDLPGGATSVSLRVKSAGDLGQEMYLVVLDARKPELPPATPETVAQRAESDPVARHLDRELERLKVHLRDTVEQYEASTEELKASNEELQAMNEELRSATEELETSREELQSINEELTTVNQELKSKVDELGHANSDMHNLMDATAIATVFLDRDLRITRFTPSAVSLFNLIPTDVGRPLTDLTSQLHYEELGADAQRVLERLVPVEREVGQADGSWYLARLLPYRTLDDRIAGVVLSFVNITERKQADEMRLWLSSVVTSSSDGIISFSLDHTILSWNKGAEQLFGYTAQEAIGRPLQMLAPGAGATRDQDQLVARIGEAGPVNNHETVRRRKDGTLVEVSLTVSPIRDEAGKVMAGTALIRDISGSKKSAEALRTSEERLRLIIENAREYAIFSMDLGRRVTIWSSGAQKILGYPEEEVLGQPADIIFVPEDRAAGAPEKEMSQALAEGRAGDDRFHQRKDGSRFWASGMMMLMRDAQGRAVGFVKILRDQTAARNAEEELKRGRQELLSVLESNEQARAELEEADRTKDRFLAVLSHELRNPLASIASAAELLGVAAGEADRTRASDVITRQAQAMRTLLDDLLDISRLRLGKLALQRRPVPLGAIVQAAVETTRPLVEAAGHKLSLRLPSHEIEVDGDPLRLGQVVSNLVTNAVKYTPAGGHLSVGMELSGPEVILTVDDDGIGIEAGELESIFGMFSQAAGGHEHSRGGLGIGLALVRNIVDLHGGWVKAESGGAGRGSQFRVGLPVLRAVASTPALPAAAPVSFPQGAGATVLVADDNSDAAWSVSKLLELSGYRALSATGGVEALALAEQHRPQVLLLDIGMPDIDGHEVARRVRGLSWGKEPVLIAATGWGQESDVRLSLEAGFDAHLTKPVNLGRLQALIAEHLAKRGG